MLYTGRTFDASKDLLRLSDFVVETRRQAGHLAFYQIGDLSWAVFQFETKGRPAEFIRIWEAPNGDIAGYAFFQTPNGVDIQSAPWLSDREALEDEMLAWAADLCRSQGSEPRLTVAACEGDDRFLRFLTERGYQQEPSYRLHMIYGLEADVPEPALPDGFVIRPVQGDEWEARGALQRSVWPWSRVGPETYPRLVSLPGYDPSLDLVVVSPEGDLAAFALIWYDRVNRVGEFEPVGTHPDFRGQKLGKALQLEGLRRVKEVGALSCLVYPTGGDVPACNLYTSAGFRVQQRLFDYSRAV